MNNSVIFINASHWHQDIYLHYVFYSPNPQIILFIKHHLAQSSNLHVHKIQFDRFYQPFACVIHDTFNNEYFLARDHFGFEPFYYTIISEPHQQLCFGSNLPDVLAHIANPVLDQEQVEPVLTDIFASSWEYTDKTFYKNVWRVTPAQILQLQFSPHFKIKHHPFWTLSPGTPFIHYASDDDYDAHFASLLQEACHASCQQAPDSIALEFSGGLDSSTLLTTLNAIDSPAQLFMHVGEVADERHYGEQLLKTLKECKANYPIHYINAADFEVVAVLNQCKQWFAGGAPYLFFMLAQNIHQAVQQQGCKILLSGFGGDECVSSHAPLRTYGAEVGYKTVWRELIALNNQDTRLRRSLQTFKFTHPSLYFGLQRIKSYRSLLARKRLPVHYKPYHSLQERESDWLQGRLSHHVRMRIEYSAVIARYMGFSYQYPLLYPPLVEFCFALPPEQKRRQGKQRLLVRRYLAKHIASGLFDTHKKCGDILPGTMPKCQHLYQQGLLSHLLHDLPYAEVLDYIMRKQLVPDERLFHVDLLRYMFKQD